MSRQRRDEAYDVVVVGGGPAGVAAATAAAESGKRVGLIDESPWLGGQIWRGEAERPHSEKARRWLKRLEAAGVTVRVGVSVVGGDGAGWLVAEDRRGAWRIGYEALILATGARDRFLPFPGWTAPHVMGVGGLQTLVKSGWPVAGKRVAIVGSGPLLWALAEGVTAAGGVVVVLAEQASWESVRRFGAGLIRYPAKLVQAIGLRARLAGVPYWCGWWPAVTRSEGDWAVVTVTDGTSRRELKCDLVAFGFGLVPNLELARLLGCGTRDEPGWEGVEVGLDQETGLSGVYAAGEATGVKGAEAALVEGRVAGYAAAGRRAEAEALYGLRDRWRRFGAMLAQAFALRAELKTLADDDTIVCRCEDVTYGRLRTWRTAREAKLMTRCGMGPCQGRVCGAACRFLWSWEPDRVRPPATVARLETLMELGTGGNGG
ncbi:MAG: oxidoreductase [Isosphaeraceae bacterium]|nr:MAG: oxidoreductase [Isosphaeraceae bacterium]